MKILKILFALVLTMMIAFVQAWAFSTLWSWFVAPQYGSGPTYPTWFGLSLIASTVVGSVVVRSDLAKNEKEGDELDRGILVGVGIIVAYFFVVGWAWVVGQIAGWI